MTYVLIVLAFGYGSVAVPGFKSLDECKSSATLTIQTVDDPGRLKVFCIPHLSKEKK